MTHDEYLAAPALSTSAIKAALVGPKHYLAMVHGGVRTPPTKEMELGTVVHSAVLEPDKRAFHLWDGGRRAGKVWDAFKAEHTDAPILKPDEAERVAGMVDGLGSNARAQSYLSQPGPAETPVFDVIEHNGMAIPRKCKPDKLISEWVVDLKTTRDPSKDAFQRQAMNLGYHIQAYWYLEVTGRDKFVFVAVRSESPYEVGTYDVHRGDATWAAGEADAQRAMSMLVEAYRTGCWDASWERETSALDLPKWFLEQRIWEFDQ